MCGSSPFGRNGHSTTPNLRYSHAKYLNKNNIKTIMNNQIPVSDVHFNKMSVFSDNLFELNKMINYSK